jgi:hypothetical protein
MKYLYIEFMYALAIVLHTPFSLACHGCIILILAHYAFARSTFLFILVKSIIWWFTVSTCYD